MDYDDMISKYFFYPEKRKKYYFMKIYDSLHTLDDVCDFAQSLYCIDVSWNLKEQLIRKIWRYVKEKDE